MLDDDLGPVCAFGSEAERVVMVPERTAMAAYRSRGCETKHAQAGRGKAASAARVREGHRGAVLGGAGPAGNSVEETPKQVCFLFSVQIF